MLALLFFTLKIHGSELTQIQGPVAQTYFPITLSMNIVQCKLVDVQSHIIYIPTITQSVMSRDVLEKWRIVGSSLSKDVLNTSCESILKTLSWR